MEGELPAPARTLEFIVAVRRAREAMFGPELFCDPAWDMLLELYGARLRGTTLDLADLRQDLPRSTLARWVAILEERGFVRCEADPGVAARLRLSLSPVAELKMASLLATDSALHPVR